MVSIYMQGPCSASTALILPCRSFDSLFGSLLISQRRCRLTSRSGWATVVVVTLTASTLVLELQSSDLPTVAAQGSRSHRCADAHSPPYDCRFGVQAPIIKGTRSQPICFWYSGATMGRSKSSSEQLHEQAQQSFCPGRHNAAAWPDYLAQCG